MCVCFEDLLVAVTTHLHGRSAWDRAGCGPLTALTPSLTLSSFPARHPPGLAQGLAGTGARPSEVLVPPIPASHRSPGAPRTHLGVGLVHRGVRATAQALGENETVQPRGAPARARHPDRPAPAPAAGSFLVPGARFRPGAQNRQRAAVGQNSTLPPAEPAESAARRVRRGNGSPPPPSPAPSRCSRGCSWAPPPPPPALEIT